MSGQLFCAKATSLALAEDGGDVCCSHPKDPLFLTPVVNRDVTALIAGWSVAEHPHSAMHPAGACSLPLSTWDGDEHWLVIRGRCLQTPVCRQPLARLFAQARAGADRRSLQQPWVASCCRGPIGPREQLGDCYANREEPGNSSKGCGGQRSESGFPFLPLNHQG